jgi:putative Holliday junction resolvase
MTSSKNFISIDYGTHKSGLAYCISGFCFAHKTIPTSILLPFLRDWIQAKNAGTIILWMPYNIDGSMSKHGKKVLIFEKILQKTFPELTIILHDERLTTSEATLSWVDDIDAESARLILEDYINTRG